VSPKGTKAFACNEASLAESSFSNLAAATLHMFVGLLLWLTNSSVGESFPTFNG